MSVNSKIEWTDETWQVTKGCSKVSSGCQNCYAERMSRRLAAMAETSKAQGRSHHKQAQYGEVIGSDGRWNGKVVLCGDALNEPWHWQKPRMVFVNSMSDLFHPSVPDEFIAKTWAVMLRYQRHTYQILTKRGERAASLIASERFRDKVLHWLVWSDHYYCAQCCDWYEHAGKLNHCPNCWHEYDPDESKGDVPLCPECGGAEYESTCPKCGVDGGNGGLNCSDCWARDIENTWMPEWPPPNIWLGVSCEDQATADERIPLLLQCPAAVRFVSLEPLLGPVDFRNVPKFNLVGSAGAEIVRNLWVIVGGETGPAARPCQTEWIRDIIGQCRVANVPVFVKQLGAVPMKGIAYLKLASRTGRDMGEWHEDLRVREWPA